MSLKEQQVNDLKEAFSLLDRNGDGKLTQEELKSVLDAIGYDPSRMKKDVTAKVESLQKDKDIDFAKFLSLMSTILKDEVSNYDDLQEGFRVFDRNNNGHISVEEFKKILTSEITGAEALTAEEIEEVLKDANVDPDGDFDYESLCQKLIAK